MRINHMEKHAELSMAACTFRHEIDFQPDGDRISVRGYSGEVLHHPLHTNPLVIDLGTLSHKGRIPMLLEHDTDRRAGYYDDVKRDDALVLSGKLFKSTPAAKEVRELRDEGFPWEASMRVIPGRIERIKSGASTSVNGRDIHGPVDVWRDGTLREVSVCTLGIDSDTGIAASNSAERFRVPIEEPAPLGDRAMADVEVTMTPEVFSEQNPEAVKAWQKESADKAREETEDAERNRFAALCEAYQDSAFVAEAFKAGDTVEDAEPKWLKLRAERAEKELAELKAKPPSQAGETVEFSATDEQVQETPPKQPLSIEDRAKKEFAESEQIRAEFRDDVDAYVAFRRADDKGLVRILRKG